MDFFSKRLVFVAVVLSAWIAPQSADGKEPKELNKKSAENVASFANVKELIRKGELTSALNMSQRLVNQRKDGAEELALHAKILQEKGLHNDVIKLLNTHLKKPSLAFLYAKSLFERGRNTEAAKTLKKVVNVKTEAQSKTSSLSDELAIANAHKLLGDYEKANELYQSLSEHAPPTLGFHLDWADLFFRTHDYANASESVQEHLGSVPNDQDAKVFLAQIAYQENYNLNLATKHLEGVLAENPHHQNALVLFAKINIDEKQWQRAEAHLTRALQANPKNLSAISLLAASYWLRDKKQAFEEQKSRLFRLNKNHGDFYHTVAQTGEHAHLYQDVVDLELKALALNPDHKDAMQTLGNNYLRLGLEDKGLKWLKKAYEKDPYNVRTVNILELYQKFIPNEYQFLETPHFKIRYHKREAELLHGYIGPFLERAFNDMSTRYRVSIPNKIIIELYKEPEHYSVRTIGVPNLGALAICFGQVITAMSPTSGGNNWQMVLWHELSHVFALARSNSRVPRWFTEGLSEYETMRAKPQWRREHHRKLYNQLQNDSLSDIESLDLSFTRGPVRNAYFHSSKVIEFVVETYGFEAILKGLSAFSSLHSSKDVLEEITGQNMQSINNAFRKHIEASSRVYKTQFRLPKPTLLKAIPKHLKQSDDSAKQLESSALKFFAAGDKGRSKQASAALLSKKPNNLVGNYILAELAYVESDFLTSKKHYTKLIALGADSFDIRVRMATIASNAGQKAEAVQQLCAAKAHDPERSYTYQKLSEHYESEGDLPKMLLELENVAALDQSDFGAHLKLLNTYLSLNMPKKAVFYGETAIALNPAHGDLLTSLAQAYFENSEYRKSIFTYDSLLALKPTTRRPALAELGKAKAYLKLNDSANAQKALKKAQEWEPENLEVLELLNSK